MAQRHGGRPVTYPRGFDSRRQRTERPLPPEGPGRHRTWIDRECKCPGVSGRKCKRLGTHVDGIHSGFVLDRLKFESGQRRAGAAASFLVTYSGGGAAMKMTCG
jgi:hypothetical protein